ncbi:MAG TPA: cyclic nucleotide-binding domain-containing protein [Roseiflexaceae bacterium]|nr:cyclic nucleotide-binding domain-containing protein [Roseiflexaceae bacterium]
MSTLAAERPVKQTPRHNAQPGGLWAALERDAQMPGRASGLWATLAARRGEPAGHWQALDERTDLARYRPQAVPDVAEEQVAEGDQVFAVIRSPRGNYLRLTPAQRELWHQMDGQRTVAQLGVAAFLQFKQLLPVGDLVTTLRQEGFLVETPIGLYAALAQRLDELTAEGWGRRLLRALTGHSWRFASIDGFYGAFYRWGARLLFTPLFLALWALVALGGLAAFVLLLGAGPPRFASAEALGWDLAGLWAALLVSFFLHESAHALTVKHFRRTLYSGGMMLYFGVPAFFVDTTDIWRSPRRARVLVSAAGPMSDLFVGGLAAAAALLAPEAWYAPVAYKLALTCYVATLFNSNPLLELDGYFILVDWLRLPDLRRRALAFVRGPLWEKLRAAPPAGGTARLLPPFSREERIFTLYGALTLVYTVVAVVFAVQFWNRQLIGTIGGLWRSEGLAARVVAGVLVVLVLVPLLAGLALAALGLGRAALAWLIGRGYGRRPELLAAVGVVGAVALAAFAARTGPAWYVNGLLVLLWLIALKALLSLRPDYRRAAIAPAIDALALATGLAAIGATLRALPVLPGLDSVADGLALLLGLLAGFTALLDVNLRQSRPRELFVSGLLLVLAFGLGGLTLLDLLQRRPEIGPGGALLLAAPAYFATLALGLLLPLLFTLRDSRLIWPWSLTWAAVLVELVAYIADLTLRVPALEVLAAALWAAGGLVHVATLRQIAPTELDWPADTGASEAERLALAFQHCYAGCYRLMRAVYGARRTRELDDRMDVLAATANWDVTLDRDEARVGVALRRLPLDQQGKRYAEVLRYTVATLEELAGVTFARRAMQSAYDALPWTERETASRLCFPDTPWARELSRVFGDAQQSRLRLLRQVDLFLQCDDAELAALLRSLREQDAPGGAVLLRAGGPPPGVWIIEAGEVLAKRDGRIVQELHRGATFGGDELLRGLPVELTYVASLPVALLFIPAPEFLALVREQAPHAVEGPEAAERLRLLERIALFADAPRQTLRALAQLAHEQHFEPRQLIVRQNQPSGMMYIIRQGQAAVVLRGPGEAAPRLLARLGPEEVFGELELLRGTPPVAHVLAHTPLVALALPHTAVRELLLGDGGVARGIEQIGSGRLVALRKVTGRET